ncbi:Nucleotide-binding universal stress protein, UspA family [Saccharopolyspora shandongensis]|uniref:Nucleotide-binding universal stress protein, UspA family n=1 Tax=Saccharopolyspora shandongensis TaxID=418495 RepID=A0A1H3QWS6_9PSEU|nr:Nucleotide-binding universal stress protein, UspA family [Saccharopolyspora shandongensis]
MGTVNYDGPLVVGIDGSQASIRALRWALREARVRAASVYAIMVWQSHAVLAGPGPLTMHPELAPHHAREQRWRDLTSIVRTCLGGESAPEVHAELLEGHPAEVLADRSMKAAMLVLGDQRHGRVADVVLGSTALRCIHKARCPVLIVPTGMDIGDIDEEAAENPGLDPVLG